MLCRLLVCLFLFGAVLPAQRRAQPHNTYQRVICVVPMVGKGTHADPRRPQYAPWPPSRSRTGIVSFFHQMSDDGKYAIVEFKALNRSAFQAILADKSIKTFEKGKVKKNDIEIELKKHKKDFDLDKFWEVAR